MKPAAKSRLLLFGTALLALLLVSCRKPAGPAAVWVFEGHAETGPVRAMFRMSAVTLTPGARLDCELEVKAPAATGLGSPHWQPAGLELVDFARLPVKLDPAGDEVRRFHWTYQAGAPQTITGQSVRLPTGPDPSVGTLAIELPVIVIGSVFAPGTFKNTLPQPEESNAF